MESEEDSDQTQGSQSDFNPQEGCDSSYPEICITTYSAKLSCGDIPSGISRFYYPTPTVLIRMEMVLVVKVDEYGSRRWLIILL